jgi:Winged helix-turn helix
MARRIRLATHLSVEELEQRYRAAQEPHERTWWQIVCLLARGQTATRIAESTGYTRSWIGQIAKRYNAEGPGSMVNRQRTTSWRAPRMLSTEQQQDLQQALAGPAPDGTKHWPFACVPYLRPLRVYAPFAYADRAARQRPEQP